MSKPVSQEIKNEYNNLVKNVEKLKMDVYDLENYIYKMNEPESTQSSVSEIETPIETPEINTPIETTQPVPEKIIEEKEEKKEELLDALTDTTEQQTKTEEQILQEQKDEMNARKTNIEKVLTDMASRIQQTSIFTSKITALKLLR